MKLSEMTDKGLVEACIKADQELAAKKIELDSYKSELQSRGNDCIENQNIKYVRFFSPAGSVSVMESQKFKALNLERLKELLGEGVFKQAVKEEIKTNYKFELHLERALKAIFTGEYTFEYTLSEFLDVMTVPVTISQKKLLIKKLKGNYVQDKRNMLIILGYMTKDDNEDQIEAPDLDTELWFIYRIKNAELIQAYLPEEDIEKTIEAIRKCILVDTSTAITVEYDKEDK